MRVRKVNSDGVKIHDSVQVKLKTAGTTQVVQFTARNNKFCPVRNLSKDKGRLVFLVKFDKRNTC